MENNFPVLPHPGKTPPVERPPIFDERNRAVWDAVRRLLIFILKELDRWYGWQTFNK
jgi:hypothetical protein